MPVTGHQMPNGLLWNLCRKPIPVRRCLVKQFYCSLLASGGD